MRIARIVPKPPPEITMQFPQGEGWAIVAALRYYAGRHPDAAGRRDWSKWADELERELRRWA